METDKGSQELAKIRRLTDRKGRWQIGNFTMNEYNFEVVQSFKYLGLFLNLLNDLEEEIKMRIS